MSYGTTHALQVFTDFARSVNLSEYYCLDCCVQQYNTGLLYSLMDVKRAWAYDGAGIWFNEETGQYIVCQETIRWFLAHDYLRRRDGADIKPLREGHFSEQYLLDKKRCSECAKKLNIDCEDYGNGKKKKDTVTRIAVTVYYSKNDFIVKKKLKPVFERNTGRKTKIGNNLVKVKPYWIRYNGKPEWAFFTEEGFFYVAKHDFNVDSSMVSEV